MVKYNDRLDSAFAALADPTRRAILSRLAKGDATVGELARPFDMSLPAVSKHLRVLERAGLMTQARQGRIRHCRLKGDPLRTAAKWIERNRRYWERQLDALAAYVAGAESDGKRSTIGASTKRA